MTDSSICSHALLACSFIQFRVRGKACDSMLVFQAILNQSDWVHQFHHALLTFGGAYEWTSKRTGNPLVTEVHRVAACRRVLLDSLNYYSGRTTMINWLWYFFSNEYQRGWLTTSVHGSNQLDIKRAQLLCLPNDALKAGIKCYDGRLAVLTVTARRIVHDRPKGSREEPIA